MIFASYSQHPNSPHIWQDIEFYWWRLDFGIISRAMTLLGKRADSATWCACFNDMSILAILMPLYSTILLLLISARPIAFFVILVLPHCRCKIDGVPHSPQPCMLHSRWFLFTTAHYLQLRHLPRRRHTLCIAVRFCEPLADCYFPSILLLLLLLYRVAARGLDAATNGGSACRDRPTYT